MSLFSWKKTSSLLKPTLPWNKALAGFLSGISFFLLYPPFEYLYVAPLAFIPLLYCLESGWHRSNGELGFLCGFVFYLGLLHWLHHVTSAGMLALVFYLALLFSLQCVVIGRIKSHPMWIPLTALAWTLFEVLRSMGPLSFSWGFMGHAVYASPHMLAMLYWIPIPFATFLIVCMNGVLTQYLCLGWRKIKGSDISLVHRPLFFLELFFLVLPLVIIGISFLSNPIQEKGNESIRVALIQGGLGQDEKESTSVEETIQLYLKLTKQSLQDYPDLVIWPESAINRPLNYWPEGVQRIQQFVDKEDVEILVGCVGGDYTPTQQWRFWNQAILFSPGNTFTYETSPVDLSSLPTYTKIHLVPFGEWIPLGNYWPFYHIETLIEEAGAGLFQPGKGMTRFETRRRVSFGVTICFESTIPWLWEEAKKKGVDFMVNITNDAWYKKSAGLEQHFSQCCFRAVETHVPVVRVANTGISGVISPTGKVLYQLPLFKSTYGVFNVPLP